MNCDRLQADLSAYCDGELTPLERDTVEKHLAGCSRCAQALQEMRRVSSLAEQLPRVVPPTDAVEQIKLQVERQSLFVSTEKPRRWWPRLVAGGFAAAAMLFLVAYSWSWLGNLGRYLRGRTAPGDLGVATAVKREEAPERVLASARERTAGKVSHNGAVKTADLDKIQEAAPASPLAEGGVSTEVPVGTGTGESAELVEAEERQTAEPEAKVVAAAEASVLGDMGGEAYTTAEPSRAVRAKAFGRPAGVTGAMQPVKLAGGEAAEPVLGLTVLRLPMAGPAGGGEVERDSVIADAGVAAGEEKAAGVLARLDRKATAEALTEEYGEAGGLEMGKPAAQHLAVAEDARGGVRQEEARALERLQQAAGKGLAIRISTAHAEDVERAVRSIAGQTLFADLPETTMPSAFLYGEPVAAASESSPQFVLHAKPDRMADLASELRKAVLAADPEAQLSEEVVAARFHPGAGAGLPPMTDSSARERASAAEPAGRAARHRAAEIADVSRDREAASEDVDADAFTFFKAPEERKAVSIVVRIVPAPANPNTQRDGASAVAPERTPPPEQERAAGKLDAPDIPQDDALKDNERRE